MATSLKKSVCEEACKQAGITHGRHSVGENLVALDILGPADQLLPWRQGDPRCISACKPDWHEYKGENPPACRWATCLRGNGRTTNNGSLEHSPKGCLERQKKDEEACTWVGVGMKGGVAEEGLGAWPRGRIQTSVQGNVPWPSPCRSTHRGSELSEQIRRLSQTLSIHHLKPGAAGPGGGCSLVLVGETNPTEASTLVRNTLERLNASPKTNRKHAPHIFSKWDIGNTYDRDGVRVTATENRPWDASS